MKNPYAEMSATKITVLWICKLIACGFLAWAGYLKLTHAQVEVDLFTELGMEPVGRLLIGGLEIGAVILLLIPQSAVYGALLGVGVMCGAIIAHATKIGFGGPFPLAILVLLCCVTVLYIRRNDAEFLRNLLDR